MSKTWKRLVGMICFFAMLFAMAGCSSDITDTAVGNGTDSSAEDDSMAATDTEMNVDADTTDADAGESEAKPSAEDLKATANEEYEIVVIEKNLANPIWIALKEGAEQAGADAGCSVTVLAPNTAESNEEQISLIQQQIAKGVDALVVIPADGTGISPAIEEANAANIPVINVDTRIDTSICSVATFIAVENYTAGKETAKGLVDLMGGSGNVIILEGKPGTQSSIDIVGGANDVFAEYDDINVVASQAANWNRTDSYNVTLNLLEANPDATAIFAANDEMAMGALQAVAQNGREGDILIAGLNANPDAVEAVNEGRLALTFDKNGYLQGYASVMAAVMTLNGETLESEYEVPGMLVLPE